MKEARALLEEVETRPLEIHVPSLLLYEVGLTFYDASFIALAVEVDCPYITADRRLFDRARALPRVRHLSRGGSLA